MGNKWRMNVDIKTTVKLTNTKFKTDLYSLFVRAIRGDFAEQASKDKDSKEFIDFELIIEKAFDSFAQRAFDAGRKYETDLNK